jgi:adenylate cyclase
VSQTYTFAFVDLAGFTALTDAHGDQVASDHVQLFTALAQAALAGETLVVNVVGDAVLLAAEDVDDALTTTLSLLEACNAEPQFPLSRAGIHTGTAVRQGADFFGAGVNVAARVTARAGGGQLLLTEVPAQRARLSGKTLHDLGSSRLRNVSQPVELFRIDIAGGEQVVDPVCRMTVEQHSAAGTLTFQGRDYWFCSLACAGTFATDPATHLPT